jgi:hypothetical protein
MPVLPNNQKVQAEEIAGQNYEKKRPFYPKDILPQGKKNINYLGEKK